jgi:SAM-dependent methyltransferase
MGTGIENSMYWMSVLDIWDFISGTGDDRPYDQNFTTTLLALLTEQCGEGALRVLDLGGGAGNPAVGMALAGHHVTLVDNDAALVSAARRRGNHAQDHLIIAQCDWRDFLERISREQHQYDAILFLGNALAYQDTWPDRTTGHRSTPRSLANTLVLCKKALTPRGVIVIESSFEPDRDSPWEYVRFHPVPATSGPAVTWREFSIWIVSCDPRQSVRIVDTIVVEPTSLSNAPIKGRISFRGTLLTQSAITEAARQIGLSSSFEAGQARPIFSIALLRHIPQ